MEIMISYFEARVQERPFWNSTSAETEFFLTLRAQKAPQVLLLLTFRKVTKVSSVVVRLLMVIGYGLLNTIIM